MASGRPSSPADEVVPGVLAVCLHQLSKLRRKERETGGEKEREEIGSSVDSAARGTDERKEARRRELKEGRRTGKRVE